MSEEVKQHGPCESVDGDALCEHQTQEERDALGKITDELSAVLVKHNMSGYAVVVAPGKGSCMHLTLADNMLGKLNSKGGYDLKPSEEWTPENVNNMMGFLAHVEHMADRLHVAINHWRVDILRHSLINMSLVEEKTPARGS